MSVLDEVSQELEYARFKHPEPYHSGHEGCAIIREEFEELWDEVKKDMPLDRQRAEAIQVAATAIRYVQDLCDGG